MQEGKSKRKKIRKIRDVDVLDEDDLDLINEAQGLPTKFSREAAEEKERRQQRERESLIQGRNAQDLSKGLFTGDTDDEGDDEDDDGNANNRGGSSGKTNKKKGKPPPHKSQLSQPERYDEDGLDDFIEDDVGDGGYQDRGGGDDVMMSGGAGGGVSEAQIQEHLDIFGTDFLGFMEGGNKDDGGGDEDGFDDDLAEKRRRKEKYRERGVGVDLGVDSDEEIEDDSDSDDDDDDDDDADLFGDDDMDQDMGDKQRAEVLRLKREKKRMAREERRRQRKERIEAKRKAQLRRAFEPVQLVENFCTERDDAIRMADSPERYYEWLEASTKTASQKRTLPKISEEISDEEEEEAFWIMQKIPAIHSEWYAFSSAMVVPGDVMAEDNEKKERAVLTSIMYALRFMHTEKFEPEFIARYRSDIVSSPAVRANLYRIMDEDGEWERMTDARSKIEDVLGGETEGDDGEELVRFKQQLEEAREKLDRTVKDEERVKVDLEGIEKAAADGAEKKDDDDDDDDDLFGDDDDEDDEAVSVTSSEVLFPLAAPCPNFHVFLAGQRSQVQTKGIAPIPSINPHLSSWCSSQ